MKTLPDEDRIAVTPIFKKQLDATNRITGDANTFVHPDRSQLMQVIPTPSIALQWLINSNGWPLGCMTSCTGAPRTFKSAFSYQLGAWFLGHGGFVQIIDGSRKLPSKVLHAMIGNDDHHKEYADTARLQISRIRTKEEFRAILTKGDELRRESYPNPEEMEFPWLSIVDSAVGANLSHIPHCNNLLGWPVAILVAYRGQDIWNDSRQDIPGHILDSTSLDLFLSTGGTSAYNGAVAKHPGAGKKGKILSIQLRHSKLGPDGLDRKISVPVLESYATDKDGKKSRSMFFDWGATDAHFLGEQSREIKDTMDVGKKNIRGHGDYFWSEALDIPEDKAIPASMFGMVIQSNEEVIKSLRNDLYIDEHPVMPRAAWKTDDKK